MHNTKIINNNNNNGSKSSSNTDNSDGLQQLILLLSSQTSMSSYNNYYHCNHTTHTRFVQAKCTSPHSNHHIKRLIVKLLSIFGKSSILKRHRKFFRRKAQCNWTNTINNQSHYQNGQNANVLSDDDLNVLGFICFSFCIVSFIFNVFVHFNLTRATKAAIIKSPKDKQPEIVIVAFLEWI